MATEKWVLGTYNWTTINSTEVNSLANGSAVLLANVIPNGTNLDIFMDISIAIGSAAFAAPNYIGFYIYPLNEDGSTYGDGRYGSAAGGPPPSNYWKGNIVIPATTGAQVGTLQGTILPPGDLKIVLYNQGGIALASGSNTVKIRTYNRSIA